MIRTIDNFDDYQTKLQFKKGEDYFRRKKVISLQVAQSGRWLAKVRGRDIYNVEVIIHKKQLQAVGCECIAYSDNNYCKHVIAVLLTIRQKKDIPSSATSTTPPDYKALALSTDPSLLKKGKTALTKRRYQEAAAIGLAIVDTAPLSFTRWYKGEEEEEMVKYINKGFELLLALCKAPLPADIQHIIYGHAWKQATAPRYGLSDYNPHWIEILAALGKGKEKKLLSLVDPILKRSIYAYSDDVLRLMKIKIALLKTLGRMDEIYTLATGLPRLYELRDILIQEAIAAKNIATAKHLAEQGMKKNAGARGNSKQYQHFRDIYLTLDQKYPNKGTGKKTAARSRK